MADEKCPYQHSVNSSIPFYTAGWDIEEARRLIEKSQHLNPRPIVIFVHPCANGLASVTRNRQSSSPQRQIARTTSSSMTVEPQGRMGRIKLTEEECTQITGSEYPRKRRK